MPYHPRYMERLPSEPVAGEPELSSSHYAPYPRPLSDELHFVERHGGYEDVPSKAPHDADDEDPSPAPPAVVGGLAGVTAGIPTTPFPFAPHIAPSPARPRIEILSSADLGQGLAPHASTAQRALRALVRRFPAGPAGRPLRRREVARMPSVREELTQLCTLCRLGTGDAMRANMLLLVSCRWRPLRREYARYSRECVRGRCDQPLPCFRLLIALVARGLELAVANGPAGAAVCCVRPRRSRAAAARPHHEMTGSQPGWTAEDYAARFILRLLEALYERPRNGEPGEQDQALVVWLRDPNVVTLRDQVWVLFLVLSRMQLEEEREIWEEMSTYQKMRSRMRHMIR